MAASAFTRSEERKEASSGKMSIKACEEESYRHGCANDQWEHLVADRRSCRRGIWRVFRLCAAWCVAAGFPSGWMRRHTGCTGMVCHLLEGVNATVSVDHQTMSSLLKHVSRNMTWTTLFYSSLQLHIPLDPNMTCLMSFDNISIFFLTVNTIPAWLGHLYVRHLRFGNLKLKSRVF